MAVEAHELYGLVVGAGGQQVARWAPRQTVDAAFVVFRAFQE